MRELTRSQVEQIAAEHPKCDATRESLRRSKSMRDPVFLIADGATAEVIVAERRDMGLVDEAKQQFENFKRSLTTLQERRAEVAKELEEIDALLEQHGAIVAPKRGRPKGSKSRRKEDVVN